MAAVGNLTINDGQATPVAHTFNPRRVGDGNTTNSMMAEYEDRVGGIVVGFPRISIMMRYPDKNLRSTKVSIKVTRPVLETVSNSTVSGIAPAPTLSYNPLFTAEFILPERSQLADRKDILAYARNFLANAVVTSAVHDLEMPW